ncbi:DNA cytosine methyltransferase [Oryzomicrobium terrae]|nr:DNA cytosine methyltransferase [Oryzomicrobium terrae]
MIYGSVCSGIEAATVAWHGLGWAPAWFSEIEPFPAAVLAHHYPHVPNLGDMTKIAVQVLRGEVEAPDILVGGTPCQAFSVAGLRNSLDDERGNLTLRYVELADAIDHVRVSKGRPPCVAVWENVPGVLSTKDNAFGCFLAGLAGENEPLRAPGGKWSNAGAVYGPRRAVAWRTLDAQYFGLAQRRRRVFVVASAREGFDPAQVLFEWDGLRRDIAPSRGQGKEPTAGTLRSSDGGSDIDHARAHHLQPVTSALDASYGRLHGASHQDANHGHSHLVPVAFGGNNTAGPIEVATARNACSSASGRMDFESETFLLHPAMAVHGTQNPDVRIEQAHTLGRNSGQENAVLAFDTTQVTSAANYSNPKPGDPCHPLAAGAHAPAIAFSCKDHGGDAGLVSPTLRAMGHGASHANAGGQVAVAYTTKLHNTGSNNAGKIFEERTTCLDANSPPPALLTGTQVRRLIPTECERLQGFPDGYTAIPWRNKPADECPDGPRYKALGNSMAVPCMRWIGRRIQQLVNRGGRHG